MTAQSSAAPSPVPQSKPFVISRTFDAARDVVFAVWTEPEHVKHWFGPKGTTIRKITVDLRPGGMSHYCLATEGAPDMWGKWTYREVVIPERINAVVAFSDEKGGITRHPFAPDWPREMLSRIEFVDQGGKTKINITWEPLNPTDAERKCFDTSHEGMKAGWSGSLDQLEEYLKSAK